VFDDALKRLYIAEEDLGLWQLAADPEDGDSKRLVDVAKPRGGLTADIEGVAIYSREDGTGYLIASSQGDSSFRIYRREGDNAFVGAFRVVGCSDGSVDEVTRTDGIEVTSLGGRWPEGMLVVHDDNSPNQPSNFKYVRWGEISEKLLRP
jgi:3-phytase